MVVPWVTVRYTDGGEDAYETFGGETWALVEELEADPGVLSCDVEM